MAFYNYKKVRNLLTEAGYLDKYGDPVDKEEYGEETDPGYDGNLHSMAADYIKELKDELSGRENYA